MAYWRRKPLKDLLSRCFRCGLCRAVCPVFLQVGREPAVARGKLQLVGALLEGQIQPSEHLAYLLSRCQVCGACEEICPADVEVTEVILRGREELVAAGELIASETGESSSSLERWGQYLDVIRAHPRRPLSAVVELLAELQTESLTVGVGEQSAVVRPHSAEGSEDQVASIMPHAAGPAGAKIKVVYFPGCADLLWPRLWRSTFRLFETFGVRAIVPREISCCGAPFLEGGDLQFARGLANENIRAVEKLDVDAMVVGCSTGQRTLDRYYRGILGFTGFPMEVCGLGDFLAQKVALPPPQTTVPAKVCYFPPRGIGRSSDGALHLLKGIPDLELVVPEDDQGYGDSLFFASVHPELHEKILGRTVESMIDLGCQIAITESPHLMILLARYLRRQEATVGVMHLAELLALAWGLGDEDWSESFGQADASKKS